LSAGVAGGCNFYWTDARVEAPPEAVLARRINPPSFEPQPYQAEAWEALLTDAGRIDVGTVVLSSADLLLDAGVRRHIERHKGIAFKAAGLWAGRPDEALLAIDIGDWDVIFLPYSVFRNHDYIDVFDRASKRGVGLVATGDVLLTQQESALMATPREVRDHLLEALPGRRFLDLAVQFALARDEVSSVLVPVRTAADVEEVLKTDDHTTLSANDIETVQRVSLGLPARRS
jgi:hypothetical protein